ncbi:MAG TPA: hypothetical protein VGJ54_09730 [Streptosporangiaceae bacterium]
MTIRGRDPRDQRDPVTQRRLWELAQDASAYLRKHASSAVRVAAALLLAASLAACNASASDTTAVMQTDTVAPLAQEVATGLPRGPGSYQVITGSVFRDQRGVYQFEWLDPGATSTPGHVAHASRLRLVRDSQLALEMPAGAGASASSAAGGEGDDPVLHLPENEDVNLIQQAQVGAAQPGPQYYPPVYGFWSPFLMGMLLGGRPAYYDPPRTIVVQQPAGTLTSGGSSTIPRVGGGSASETAKAPAQRVTAVQSAVSGRAGGTGTGSAVSNRNLASGSSSASSAARSGSSGAATSSGGVSAPRSGGFSSGVGSSGGSSAS